MSPDRGPRDRPSRNFLLLSILLLTQLPFGAGCASRGGVRHHPIPPLTERQIMGFDVPDGMMKDPGSGQWAMTEVMEAYLKMKEAARRDGFQLVLVSARRSFIEQRTIWNRKWRQMRGNGETNPGKIASSILRFTHVPGYSRHHWGTDLDLSEEVARHDMLDPIGSQTNRSAQFYRWLKEHAPSFGFCQTYRGSGIVKDEPWHWSYLRLANFYEEQMERLLRFDRIRGHGILGEEFLRDNLRYVVRQQRKSVDVECRSIYEETDGRTHPEKPRPQLTPVGQKRIINSPFFLTFPTPSEP
jgi:LAS superfamily LD-carboxypeptidase LdcB